MNCHQPRPSSSSSSSAAGTELLWYVMVFPPRAAPPRPPSAIDACRGEHATTGGRGGKGRPRFGQLPAGGAGVVVVFIVGVCDGWDVGTVDGGRPVGTAGCPGRGGGGDPPGAGR